MSRVLCEHPSYDPDFTVFQIRNSIGTVLRGTQNCGGSSTNHQFVNLTDTTPAGGDLKIRFIVNGDADVRKGWEASVTGNSN